MFEIKSLQMQFSKRSTRSKAIGNAAHAHSLIIGWENELLADEMFLLRSPTRQLMQKQMQAKVWAHRMDDFEWASVGFEQNG